MNDQISDVWRVSMVARSAVPAVCMYMSGWCLWSARADGCVVIRLRAGTFTSVIWGESGEERVMANGKNGRLFLDTRFDRTGLLPDSSIQATSADENLWLRHFSCSCTNPYAAPEDIPKAQMPASSFTDMATALPTKESGTYEEPSSTITTATCTHRSQLSPPTFADRPDPP